MYSDNGTNFEGASNILKDFQELTTIVESPEVFNAMANDGITWHFNPPAAPHHGGVWEINVKAVKMHLRRMLVEDAYTYEEFLTLLKGVEAIINSRPLSTISQNPDDLEPLTPGHFLIGTSLLAPPEPDYQHLKLNRLNRYQLLRRKLQEFWTRWSQEYLGRLQKRSKWAEESPNFQVDDRVLIIEENVPCMKWNIGRIIEVHKGKDDMVRVVTLETQCGYDKNGKRFSKVFKRPISKLALLPKHDNDD